MKWQWILPFCIANRAYAAEEQFRLIGQITKYGLYGAALVMLAVAPLRQQRSAYLSSLWLLWSFVNYTRWFAAIDVPTDSNYTGFYEELAGIMCPLGSDSPRGEEINESAMTRHCATQSLFLVNATEMLIVWGVSVTVLLCAVLIGIGATEGVRFSIKTEAKYSVLFRGVTLTILDLTIFAVIQLKYASAENGFDLSSMIAAIGYLIFALGFMVFLPVLICKGHQKISTGLVPESFSTLVDEFRSGLGRWSYQYETIVLYHRVSAALVLSLMYTSPKAQISLLCGLDTILLSYILWTRPYPKPVLFVCSVLLHLLSLALLVVQGLFFVDSIPREVLAIVSVALFELGVVVSLVRYFATVKGDPANSQIAHADTINSNSDHHPSLYISSELKSQLPNEPYLSMRQTSIYTTPIPKAL